MVMLPLELTLAAGLSMACSLQHACFARIHPLVPRAWRLQVEAGQNLVDFSVIAPAH